ncbi:unnamed protein product [Chrysoparadoxa australica]
MDLGPSIVEVKNRFSQDVSVVGIVGAGGMGKSTLARAIYHELLPDFGNSRAGAVEVGQEGDISVSLNTVLQGLGAENERGSVAERKGQLETALEQGPVLLLLDNLWTKEHLSTLLPCYPAPGSRVLVTTRDSSIVAETAHRKQLHMPVLGVGSALALFRHHTEIDTGAGSEATLQDLESEIVIACGGMPLAVEVVGGQLKNVTSQDEWEEALDALRKGFVGDTRLAVVLETTLAKNNGIEDMFLDAATVFHGQSVQQALYAWQAMYKHLPVPRKFDVLLQVNLVKRVGGCIWVHDVLRQLAGQRSMAKHPGKRMWKTNQTLMASEVASIVGSSLLDRVSQRHQWQQMTQLEVLLLDSHDQKAGVIAQALLGGSNRELKWIQCRSGAANGCCDTIALQQDLVVLDLEHWSSITSLPESLCGLKALQHLNLSWCYGLTTLPESLGCLKALQHLNLKGCKGLISLPESLGHLMALQHLDLEGCSGLTSLPKSLGDLTALQHLNLGWCKCLTSLPESLGTIPAGLGEIKQLTYLSLSSLMLEGSVPPELGQLICLKELVLDNNELSGPIPASLIGLLGHQITRYKFGGNRGLTLPEDISTQSHLIKLDLSDQDLTGAIPSELALLSKLKWLDLSKNSLSGPIPASLIGLLGHQITTYKFGGNRGLTLPEDISTQSHLRKLDLSDQGLTGPIPAALGELFDLQVLHLNNNKLESNIPSQLGELCELRELWLSNNQLSGSIPPALSKLSNLQELDLSNNQLSGPIPRDLGNLVSLVQLSVSQNQLSGPIPEELGKLIHLQELHVQDNELSEIEVEAALSFKSFEPFTFTSYKNPWVLPPIHIVEEGDFEFIERYLIAVKQHGQAESWKLRVMLLGFSGAGKTSLMRSLTTGVASCTGGGDVSTVGIEMKSWQPREEYPLEVSFWDFAGQELYYAYHQLFITAGTLCLLVVDLSSTAKGSGHDSVMQWVDTLLARVPGCCVVLVGTHSDMLTEEAAEERLKSLGDAILSHVAGRKKEAERARQMEGRARSDGNTEPSLQLHGYFAVSSKSYCGIERLAGHICELALNPKLFEHVGCFLALPYIKLLEIIDDLRQKGVVCIRDDDLLQRLVKLLDKTLDNPRKTMEEAIRTSLRLGAALEACGYVHLVPGWLMALVKPLADHNLKKRVEGAWKSKWEEELLKLTDKEAGMGTAGECITFNDLMGHQKAFLESGLVTTPYLHCLWQLWWWFFDENGSKPFHNEFKKLADAEEFEFFLRMQSTMAKNGVIIPVERQGKETPAVNANRDVKDGDANLTALFVAPPRLESNADWEVIKDFLTFAPQEKTTLRSVCKMHSMPLPPGALLFFLAQCLLLEGTPGITSVVIMACASCSAHLRINFIDALVTVGRREILLYVSGSFEEKCREAAYILCEALKSMLTTRFKGLNFTGPVSDGRRAWKLAMELGLLGPTSDCFDIFLSHAGPEKWGVVHSLHTSLWDKGRRAFLDRENLEPGKNAPDIMVAAAERASIGVVMLSPSFVSRKWPLRELAIFMSRSHKQEGTQPVVLVPLFYKLTPDECGDPDALPGKYPEVRKQWDEWEGDPKMRKKLKSWKVLLRILAKRTGIEYAPMTYEAEYVKIVADTLDSILSGHEDWNDEMEADYHQELSEEFWQELREETRVGEVEGSSNSNSQAAAGEAPDDESKREANAQVPAAPDSREARKISLAVVLLITIAGVAGWFIRRQTRGARRK